MREKIHTDLLPSRILMTSDTVGGVWTYSNEMVRGLAKHHIEVHIATMGTKLTDDQWREIKTFSNVKVYESSFKLEWMEGPWEDIDRAGEWLMQLQAEIKPDLIHLNNYCFGNLAWKAPVLMVGHSCVLSWWKAVKGEEAPSSYDTYRQRVREGLHAAQIVVAPTQSMLKSLQEYYGPFRNEAVVSNARVKELFRMGEKWPLVFSLGRLWDEAKNITLLEQVADELPWKVCIAGENNHPVTEANHEFNYIKYLGKISPHEVSKVLSEASIYVMPAKYEPFGLSVLEAALSGCAMVLGDIPSLRENWDEAALFVDPNDPVDLKAQILKLILNPDIRQKLSQNAYEKAQSFTIANMIDGYLTLYAKLIHEKQLAEQAMSDF